MSGRALRVVVVNGSPSEQSKTMGLADVVDVLEARVARPAGSLAQS